MNLNQPEAVAFSEMTVARPKFRRPVWGLSRFWWAVLTFWLLVSLAAGLEIVLLQAVSLQEAVMQILTRLIPWLFMTALIIPISSAYTLDRAGWRRTIWIYLAAFTLSLGVVALCAYLGPLPPLLAGQSAELAKLAGDFRPTVYLIFARMTYQVPTFWGLVAVAHIIRFYEREDARKLSEAELRAQLIQARLQALQSQLNPHFLFNALNSIASLVHENPATAEQMIEALGELLRLAATTHRQQVTVREELHFLDQYLLIQRIRFGERLQIEKQIDETVLDDWVPVLILQPLVENAVKHGVETQLGASRIEIFAQPARAGNFLRLQVNNSGPTDAAPRKEITEGVGLSNTRARVLEMFGPQASLELDPQSDGGFVARVLLPRQRIHSQTLRSKMEAAT